MNREPVHINDRQGDVTQPCLNYLQTPSDAGYVNNNMSIVIDDVSTFSFILHSS